MSEPHRRTHCRLPLVPWLPELGFSLCFSPDIVSADIDNKAPAKGSRVAIMGNCSGELRDSQGTTSYLIDDRIAIDAGTGLFGMSEAQTSRIEHIVLSHQHFDHICSLPLLINTHYPRYVERPLQIWAHPVTIENLRKHIFNDQIWPDFSAIPSAVDGVLKFNPVEHNQPTSVGGLELSLIPVVHTVLSSAVALSSKEGGVIYSSDTTVNDTIWEFLNRNSHFEILFVECTFTDKEQQLAERTGHYCPGLLHDDLLKLSRPVRNIFLSHSPHPIKGEILNELRGHASGKPWVNGQSMPEHPVVGRYYPF